MIWSFSRLPLWCNNVSRNSSDINKILLQIFFSSITVLSNDFIMSFVFSQITWSNGYLLVFIMFLTTISVFFSLSHYAHTSATNVFVYICNTACIVYTHCNNKIVNTSIDIAATHFFSLPLPLSLSMLLLIQTQKNSIFPGHATKNRNIKIKRREANEAEWKINKKNRRWIGSNRVSNGMESFEFVNVPFMQLLQFFPSSSVYVYAVPFIIKDITKTVSFTHGTFLLYESGRSNGMDKQKCQRISFLFCACVYVCYSMPLLCVCVPLSTYFRFNFTLGLTHLFLS